MLERWELQRRFGKSQQFDAAGTEVAMQPMRQRNGNHLSSGMYRAIEDGCCFESADRLSTSSCLSAQIDAREMPAAQYSHPPSDSCH